MIKRRKHFPNASKIEELQEEHGNTMTDIRGKKHRRRKGSRRSTRGI